MFIFNVIFFSWSKFLYYNNLGNNLQCKHFPGLSVISSVLSLFSKETLFISHAFLIHLLALLTFRTLTWLSKSNSYLRTSWALSGPVDQLEPGDLVPFKFRADVKSPAYIWPKCSRNVVKFHILSFFQEKTSIHGFIPIYLLLGSFIIEIWYQQGRWFFFFLQC